jgi:hypothetical protein
MVVLWFWYKNKSYKPMCQIEQAHVLNYLVLNLHIPAYLGSRGEPLCLDELFLFCLPIVHLYKFVYTNLYYTSSQYTLICISKFFFYTILYVGISTYNFKTDLRMQFIMYNMNLFIQISTYEIV